MHAKRRTVPPELCNPPVIQVPIEVELDWARVPGHLDTVTVRVTERITFRNGARYSQTHEHTYERQGS